MSHELVKIVIVRYGIHGGPIAKHLEKLTDNDMCLIVGEYRLANHYRGRNPGVIHGRVVTLDFDFDQIGKNCIAKSKLNI
jgi:hypothetical protein